MDLLVEALVEDLSHGEGLQARHGGGGGRICECEKKIGLGFFGWELMDGGMIHLSFIHGWHEEAKKLNSWAYM